MEDTIPPQTKDLGTDIHGRQNLSPICAAFCPYILDRIVVSTNFLSTIQFFVYLEKFLPGHLKEEIFAGINFGEYFEHVTGNNFHDFGIPKDFAVINFRGYDLYKVGIRGL